MPKKRKKRKKSTSSSASRVMIKEITVGVLGQEPKKVLVEQRMTAQELAKQIGVESFTKVKATKTTLAQLKEIDAEDKFQEKLRKLRENFLLSLRPRYYSHALTRPCRFSPAAGRTVAGQLAPLHGLRSHYHQPDSVAATSAFSGDRL